MAWVVIKGKKVWDAEIGFKYCKECGVRIFKPKGFKQLSDRTRAAWSCRRYCSNYCRWKYWWNSTEGIIKRREKRRTPEQKIRLAEYQRRYRAKWRDKVNERKRLKRASLKQKTSP